MTCRCEVRGFRNLELAYRVYHEATKHLGLTRAHDFYQCAEKAWHWSTTKHKETA